MGKINIILNTTTPIIISLSIFSLYPPQTFSFALYWTFIYFGIPIYTFFHISYSWRVSEPLSPYFIYSIVCTLQCIIQIRKDIRYQPNDISNPPIINQAINNVIYPLVLIYTPIFQVLTFR